MKLLQSTWEYIDCIPHNRFVLAGTGGFYKFHYYAMRNLPNFFRLVSDTQ